MKKQTFNTEIAGKNLSVEIGELGLQADGAVRVQYGETVVLATVVASGSAREGLGYFPLTVEFDERFYAAGRIKGSRWIKREGRPSDEAILTARLIDRTIRPLFNQRMRNEVQVVATVLSFDEENDADIAALFGASLAILISPIPWSGPVGAVRVGTQNNEFIVNPSYAERTDSTIDLVVSGPKGLVNMIEAKGTQITDEQTKKAFSYAEEERQKLIDFQLEIQRACGAKKDGTLLPKADEALRAELKELMAERLEPIVFGKDPVWKGALGDLKREILEVLLERHGNDSKVRSEADILFEEELDSVIHKNILDNKKRPDGRALGEIRALRAQVGILPRTHGSGLFERGTTQALSVLTLGAPGLEQSIETMETVGTKRFMHHYNFPPFSTGETGRMGTPGRREIGHGALAEKAIEAIIPPKDIFPYTIRVVTEILSSNGSTSMASVCGSTLALMDAGVPIIAPVAGISIGLAVADTQDPDSNYELLTDIQGPEDHHGDMDFKIAGSTAGITAMQMDVKIPGITQKIIGDAIDRASQARTNILEVMAATLKAPRAELSKHAPRVYSLQIDPSKIRDVIGSGGKTINQITESTGVAIDIEDSGLVFVTSKTGGAEGAEQAVEWIRNLTRKVEPGEVFTGKVVRMLNFGAFVEVLPNQQGLVHVSELAPWHVEKVEDMVKLGDTVQVRVKEIDSEGRINLTMKEFISEDDPRGRNASPRPPQRRDPSRPPFRGRDQRRY